MAPNKILKYTSTHKYIPPVVFRPITGAEGGRGHQATAAAEHPPGVRADLRASGGSSASLGRPTGQERGARDRRGPVQPDRQLILDQLQARPDARPQGVRAM